MSKKKDTLLVAMPATYVLTRYLVSCIAKNWHEIALVKFKLAEIIDKSYDTHKAYLYENCIDFSPCIEELVIKHNLNGIDVYELSRPFSRTTLKERSVFWFTYNEFKKWFKKCA